MTAPKRRRRVRVGATVRIKAATLRASGIDPRNRQAARVERFYSDGGVCLDRYLYDFRSWNVEDLVVVSARALAKESK